MLSPDDLRQVQDEIQRNNTSARFNVVPVQQHRHLGTDSPTVSYLNLTNRQFIAGTVIPGALAADDANYGTFFIAPFTCSIQSMYLTHATNSSGSTTVSLQLLRDGQLPGSGSLTVQTFDISSGAGLTTFSRLIRGHKPLILNEFDKLALYIPADPTSCTQLVIDVVLEY